VWCNLAYFAPPEKTAPFRMTPQNIPYGFHTPPPSDFLERFFPGQHTSKTCDFLGSEPAAAEALFFGPASHLRICSRGAIGALRLRKCFAQGDKLEVFNEPPSARTELKGLSLCRKERGKGGGTPPRVIF
jgi:hypothetical protein